MSRTLRAAVTATGLAVALGACGDDGATHQSNRRAQPVKVVGTEYGYTLPTRIRGGVVEMEFVNAGKEVHEYAMGYVDPPHAAKDLVDLILDPASEANQEQPGWTHDVGGVPALSPGERVTITRRLKPGKYALLCSVPAADGKTHLEHGMHREFTVAGTSDAALPRADAVIEAQERRFAVPPLKAGPTTIELRNGAAGERGFVLLRLKPGKTLKDVQASFERNLEGPDPAVFEGAMQSIPPGSSVFLGINLKAGATYVISDDESGARSRFVVAPASSAGGPDESARGRAAAGATASAQSDGPDEAARGNAVHEAVAAR